MRVLEGLALASSGAILLSSVTSQAADLPSRKSAPADYVRVCDTYGTGFYWIPGTDTCLKVGGRVRYDMSYVPAKNAVVHRSTVGNGLAAGTFVSANGVDTIGDNLRASVTMDARTQTAWGTLQTAMSIRVSGLSGIMNAPPGYPNGFFASGNGPGTGIEFAYIRFAGFTAGIALMNSLFLRDTPLLSSSAGDGHPPFVPQLTYTATFGSGFSATFGIEDRTRPISMTTGTLGADASAEQQVIMTAASRNCFISHARSWNNKPLHGIGGSESGVFVEALTLGIIAGSPMRRPSPAFIRHSWREAHLGRAFTQEVAMSRIKSLGVVLAVVVGGIALAGCTPDGPRYGYGYGYGPVYAGTTYSYGYSRPYYGRPYYGGYYGGYRDGWRHRDYY